MKFRDYISANECTPRDVKGEEEEFDGGYSIQPSSGATELIHSITKTNDPSILPSICVNFLLYKDTWILEGAVNDETEDAVEEFYRMAKFWWRRKEEEENERYRHCKSEKKLSRVRWRPLDPFVPILIIITLSPFIHHFPNE